MPEIKWNATLYDDKHAFVSKYGEDVIGWLNPQPNENILDVGCGTGTLTQKLAQTGAQVTGIDASAEMISQATAAYPQIQFFVKNATALSFNQHFDAVFSNATLHWINEQQKALQCIYESLKTGGRFIFEMGGKHNIESIHNAVKGAMEEAGLGDKISAATNYFPSVGEQTSLLEKVGFTISNVAYFKRPTILEGDDGMRNWIIQFCGFFFKEINVAVVDRIIDNAVAKLKPLHYKDGLWTADYVRLRIKAIKD